MRVALGQQLARLPCAIARHLDAPCPATASRVPVPLLPIGLLGVMMLLSGTEEQVTPAVEQVVYSALVRIIRHHSSGFGANVVEPAFQWAMRGMKSKDRNVRLRAG